MGDEYVHVEDLRALRRGFHQVLHGSADRFSYASTYPTPSCETDFYEFTLLRSGESIEVTLRIFDCLCDDISVTQTMSQSEFEEFTRRFSDEIRPFL